MSTWEYVSEEEFRENLYVVLDQFQYGQFEFVTGPGRSGAVASVYASHYLGIPFIPHKAGVYSRLTSGLIVDTARYTGGTLRKSANWHRNRGLSVETAFVYAEDKGHYFKFWYEEV